MALGRKTGGRQKGTRNRATAEARAVAEATGILPLDYMLSVMRDESLDRATRMDAAKAAAPYLHPKLSPIEAKSSESERSEPTEIRVTFVRPSPRHEDDENVAHFPPPCHSSPPALAP